MCSCEEDLVCAGIRTLLTHAMYGWSDEDFSVMHCDDCCHVIPLTNTHSTKVCFMSMDPRSA
jgi:hypothetical protein